MAKATYEYPEDIGFREAARTVLEATFGKMMANEAGTLAGVEQAKPTPEQVEALHDMRVGSRRLRAALSIFTRVFPRDDFRILEQEIKAVTDALGGVRDLDVQLEYLNGLCESLPENEAYGIGRLIKRRVKLRETERKRLRKALKRLEKDRFEKRFQRALDRALPAKVAAPEGKGAKGDKSGKKEA